VTKRKPYEMAWSLSVPITPTILGWRTPSGREESHVVGPAGSGRSLCGMFLPTSESLVKPRPVKAVSCERCLALME
jgi:hypothetical protein